MTEINLGGVEGFPHPGVTDDIFLDGTFLVYVYGKKGKGQPMHSDEMQMKMFDSLQKLSDL